MNSTLVLIVLGLLAFVGGVLLTLWWRNRGESSHSRASSSPYAAPQRDRIPLSDHALETQVRALLAQRNAIAAIKLVREQTGWGLNEAKDYVDRLKES